MRYYLRCLEELLIYTAQALEMEEPVLQEKLLTVGTTESERYSDFVSRCDYFLEELKRRGVTRLLLWEEYRKDHPQGYGYTQFC